MTGPTRRARAAGGRRHRLDVALSSDELSAVTAAAGRVGMAPRAWLGEQGVRVATEGGVAGRGEAARVVVGELSRLREEVLALRRVLTNVGGNLNDVARHVNATGELAAETAAVQRLVARVVTRVEDVADGVLGESMAVMAGYRGVVTPARRGGGGRT